MKKHQKHQRVILIAVAIALGLAVLRIDVPSPPEWLVTWTGWVVIDREAVDDDVRNLDGHRAPMRGS